MKHEFTITVETPDASKALLVRDEAVNAIQDYIDSNRPSFNIDCGALDVNGTELDKLYAAAAHDQHHKEGEIEVDHDAPVSYGDDAGAYVRAWVWVDETPLLATAREALEAQQARQIVHLAPDNAEGSAHD